MYIYDIFLKYIEFIIINAYNIIIIIIAIQKVYYNLLWLHKYDCYCYMKRVEVITCYEQTVTILTDSKADE